MKKNEKLVLKREEEKREKSRKKIIPGKLHIHTKMRRRNMESEFKY